ncbi:hypothetical protein V0288_02675 [Pannus brasiliensis CCIBt3594]|uniref:Uncharacterized protein n=1 Tax=Pannus brasiliensis CCIBt3594 TaxID=1427578 RepID=A0AAW9QPT4_9CHRO
MKKHEMNLWVSAVAGPFLLTYLGVRSLSRWAIEVGKTSEEIFRGDRLPVLRVPGSVSENGAESEKG